MAIWLYGYMAIWPYIYIYIYIANGYSILAILYYYIILYYLLYVYSHIYIYIAIYICVYMSILHKVRLHKVSIK